jgi:dipeptidyl-peptidase-4
MKKLIIPFTVILLFSNSVIGQNEISIEDYDRAVGLLVNNVHNKKAFNLFIQPNWFNDSTGLWYKNHSTDAVKYLQVMFPDGEKAELFDHQKLAEILSDSLDKKIRADSLPISGIEYLNKQELKITAAGREYILNLGDYSLKIPETTEKENELETLSPDKKWIAYAQDYNLYIKSTETNEIKQLSFRGDKHYEYASWYGWGDIMEGENGDRPEQFAVSWSKDSKWIHTSICDLRSAQKMYLLDWSRDSLYRPRLLSYYRGSPGDTAMVYMHPVFFNIETGDELKPDLPRVTHINQIDVTWFDTPGKVYLEYQSRGYQDIELYEYDLETDQLTSIYQETSPTNIDNFTYLLAEKSGLLFFLSEKSGWRQLYSLDLETKKEKALTAGEYYINGIDKISEEEKKLYIRVSGKDPSLVPYLEDLYSLSFNGGDMRLLTPEKRHHRISISPDGKYFIDNNSTVNLKTITVLRTMENGEILSEIGKADISGLGEWTTPEVFTATARDGTTTIYGAIWKPGNFDPGKKYPVIDNSYTGPHTAVFPREFRSGLYSSNTSLAELGFIVIVVDGLGSSGRSKKFHDYSYKNLGGNLEDHVGAIRQLADRYSWIDTTRVGIFGHSAGGYDAAHALLAYPDFYKVAVASSADHDHRMEKAWWPEMYMGWPVDSAYHLQSNITMAGNLKGKLLITHGGIDENVNPSATFKLADALIRNDKQFDMLILPSQHHGYRGDFQKYFTKMRWNYFVEHLLGEEPVWDLKWE